MKQFLEWWRRPQMHIHFVEPRKRTNPLAEEAIDSLKQTLGTLESAIGFVNKLQNDLARWLGISEGAYFFVDPVNCARQLTVLFLQISFEQQKHIVSRKL